MAGQDPRLLGLLRLLGLEALPAEGSLAAIVRSRAPELGAALAAEAAESDDVMDADSAAAYLELRMHFLAGLIPADVRPTVRKAFAERVAGW